MLVSFGLFSLFWDLLGLLLFGWRKGLHAGDTGLAACPACYGNDLCRNLSSISLDPFLKNFLEYGPGSYVQKARFSSPSGVRAIVIKRLGYQAEIDELDQTWCNRLALPGSVCHSKEAQGYAAVMLARQSGGNGSQILAMASDKPSIAHCVSGRLWRTIKYLYDSNKDCTLSPQEAAMLLTTVAINAEPIVLKVSSRILIPQRISSFLSVIIHKVRDEEASHLRLS